MIARTATAVVVCLLPGFATGEPLMDLHDIAVGMTAQQLPGAGYRDFACTTGQKIAAWTDVASCPAGGDGLRAVHFAYDELGGETKVAGHPVILTAFFDGSGRLARIEVRTDDRTSPFLRKKAYMLARQTKAHYGDDGWTCKTIPASEGEEPIGPVYVNNSCTKISPQRRIEVSNRLFRWKGGAPRAFVSDTSISIAMVPGAAK